MSQHPLTIPYSVVDGLEINIDLYVPPGITGSAPAVVFYHGGGIVSGSRDDFYFQFHAGVRGKYLL